MKRWLLSVAVLGSFTLFSLYYRAMDFSARAGLRARNKVPKPAPEADFGRLAVPTVVPPSPTVPAVTAMPQMMISPTMMMRMMRSGYADGTFVGNVADALYGNIQVQVQIQGGKLTDVVFLQYPNDRNQSIEINGYAMPILKSEAIAAQSANVDIVSGATASSQAFIESLQSALQKAKG